MTTTNRLPWFSFRRLSNAPAEFPTGLDPKRQATRFNSALWSFSVSWVYRWLNSAPTETAPTREDAEKALLSEIEKQAGWLPKDADVLARKIVKRVYRQWDARVAERYITANLRYTEEEMEAVSHLSVREAARELGCSPTTVQQYRKPQGITVFERLRRLASYAKSLVKRELVQQNPPITTKGKRSTSPWLREVRKAKAALKYALPPMEFNPPSEPTTFTDFTYLLEEFA